MYITRCMDVRYLIKPSLELRSHSKLCILYWWSDPQGSWLGIIWSSFSEKEAKYNRLEFETAIQNLSELSGYYNFLLQTSYKLMWHSTRSLPYLQTDMSVYMTLISAGTKIWTNWNLFKSIYNYKCSHANISRTQVNMQKFSPAFYKCSNN